MSYQFKGAKETPKKQTEGPRPAHWAKPGPKPRPLPPFNPALCGTMDGYRQHRRHGVEQCQPCKDANTAKGLAYRQRKQVA